MDRHADFGRLVTTYASDQVEYVLIPAIGSRLAC